MRIHRPLGLAASLISLFAVFAIACSDDDGASAPTEPAPTPEAGADVTQTQEPDAAKEDAAKPAITVANVVAFDPAKGELPEALSYRDGFAYVSLAPTAVIEKVSIADGTRATYATLPIEASNFVLGSTFDAAGNLFVGVGATNPSDAAGVAAAGIYEIGPSGGTATLFASSASGLKFGNGLAFDAAGSLFVTDAAEGAIYKIPAEGAVGTAAVWKQDAALTGDMAACPVNVAGFPIGANGIFVDADGVWVGNTDRGSLVKVAIEANGSAGAATTVVADCANLEGLDGLRPDPRSPTTAFIGTNNPKNTLVHITRTGAVSVLHEASPPDLDGPADLVHIEGTASPWQLLVVNSAFPEAFAPPDAGLVPKPSLVKVALP